MSELKASLKVGSTRWVLTGVGGGAGLVLGIAAIKSLTVRPEFLAQLLNGGTLFFVALIFAMLMARSQFKDFNAMQERHVVAQEQLAQNVGALVSKDDERAREIELTINHLARQMDRNMEQNDSILMDLARLNRGAPAEGIT